MNFKLLLAVAMFAVFGVACAKEAPPPPEPAPAAEVAKAAPEAPKIVYASAEPQYGGVRQKVGDYMVELATGTEGQMATFVQLYEGDTPAFEDVQVEMQVTASAAAGQASGDEEAAKKEEETPEPQDVIFFVKDGKLQGTVAGLTKGTYDVSVKIYDLKTDQMAEQNFKAVAIEPLETSLEPKHGGMVKLVDKAKMEIVQEGKTVKIYFRDLEDKKIKPEEAKLTDLVVSVQDGVKETVNLETKGDHFVTEVSADIVPEHFKILMANLTIREQSYPKIRIPNLAVAVESAKKTVRKAPPMTESKAKKADEPAKMKGTIGTMKVGKLPVGKILKPKASVSGSVNVSGKTKKAKVSTGKKAE